MKFIKDYFTKEIVSKEVFSETFDTEYIYHPKKSFLGFHVQKEGCYKKTEPSLAIDIPDGHVVDSSGLIMRMPCICLRFKNNIEIFLYFETYNSALEIFNNINNHRIVRVSNSFTKKVELL